MTAHATWHAWQLRHADREVRRLTRERDRARAWAVELEQLAHRLASERDDALAAADLATLQRDLAGKGYLHVLDREAGR